jgi:phosphatidylserine/phosphatidylglycerophosphate/cardiolipin synthase-like enzyme
MGRLVILFILMRKILFLLILSLILSSCGGEYQGHYVRQHRISTPLSGESIIPLENTGDILILPDLRTKDTLIESINATKKRIWIEIYTWTDKDILASVIDAHRRGVDVRVILEPNVYGTPRINSPTYKTLKSAGIDVAYADGYRYVFTHAKFFLLDDIFYISTGNLTYSSFTKNRDIIYRSTNSEILEFLSSIFLADQGHL